MTRAKELNEDEEAEDEDEEDDADEDEDDDDEDDEDAAETRTSTTTPQRRLDERPSALTSENLLLQVPGGRRRRA